MARLELRLLGGLDVRVDGARAVLPTRHCGLLLAYLAVNPGMSESRERLATLLWGERADEQARASLRQTLYRLKEPLEGVEPAPLVSDPRSVSLAESLVRCDVAAFERAIDGDEEALLEARDLYKGDLLADCGRTDPAFEDWLAEERERLRRLAADGFHRLAEMQQAGRRFREMEATARKLVELNPYDEAARRLQMTACALRGQRNAALAIYKDLADLLDRELDVEPEPETDALLAAIRDGDLRIVDEPADADTQAADEAPPRANRKDDAKAAATEPERKEVSVLCVHMDGPSDVDAEALAGMMDPLFRAAADAVERYGGTVASRSGDEVMALFGATTAQEDHAVRACNAALAIRQATAARRPGIAVRVGLHGGEVVVRAAGDEPGAPREAVGPAILLAARIARAMQPGRIGVSDDVRRKVEGFFTVEPAECETLPVALFELVADTGAHSRWQAWAGRTLTRFVGRAHEIAELDRALARARAGQGEVAAVVGPPGIGKSRLLHEFLLRPETEGFDVLKTGAASHDEQAIYLPVGRLLRAWLRVEESDAPAAIADKLARKVAELGERMQTALPALATLLDLPVADAAWAALSPPQRRRRIIDAVTSALVAESRKKPLLVVVEDLHWIDPETRAVLDGLVAGLAQNGLLLVVCYRPEFRHDWAAKSFFRLIRLDPLAGDNAETLLTSILGAAPDLATLRHLLLERTAGVPLFMEETVRALAEMGTLSGRPGAYRLEKPTEDIVIPPTVHGMLAARIDRLPPEQKALLQMAAVIGPEAALPLLERIAELDQDALLDRLMGLEAAEMLYRMYGPADETFAFKHALTRDVAYGTLLVAKRRTLHARLVEIIEAHYHNRIDEHVERLAQHARQGEVWDKAADYLYRAGVKAVETSAYHQAQSFLTGALEALDKLPDSPDVARRVIDIRLHLRAVLALHGDFPAILDNLQKAEALAAEIADRPRLGGLHLHKSYLLSTHGRLDEAVADAERALSVAKDLGDEQMRHEAILAYCQAASLQGHTDDVIDRLAPRLDYWLRDHRHERFGQMGTRSIWCLVILASARARTGAADDALRLAKEACAIAEETKRPVDLVFSQHRYGELLLRQKNTAAAIPILEKVLDLIADQDMPLYLPWAAGDLGWAYALDGRHGEAERLLQQARDAAKRLGLLQFEGRATMTMGKALLLAKREEAATALFREALSIAREIGDRALEAAAIKALDPAPADKKAS